MDRNREARRAANMAAPPNGLSSSRRRHRSSSLRDSPDEDGGMELQEPGRLRDRGVIKKDRDRDRGDRERERERERDRSSRSKRRRENRMMMHHVTTASNRDDGDDTSEESVNDEDEEDDDDGGSGCVLRMLPPPPANPSTAAVPPPMTTNHHPQQLHHRKSFPPSANKVFKAAAVPPPAWKAADEMIGVSVPRKARSASTKRSHEWISGGGGAGVGGVGGAEQIHGQSSSSPVRLASAVASPAPAAPPSPSSSNVSVRKKMKANGGGSKPRPPKSSSKSSSSNPEELEIEIAEVLYGLMTQSQAPSKKESNDATMKFESNKSSSDTKSRVSSPISNSTAPPQNSTPLSAVAPKRKRPRQVSENLFSVRSSPVSSSMKTEIDHHNQSPKTEVSSPKLEHNNPGSAVAAPPENSVHFGFSSLPNNRAVSAPPSVEPPPPRQPVVEEEGKCGGNEVLTKEEVIKESPAVRLSDGNSTIEATIATAASMTATNLNTAISEIESKKEEKFEIDLMAPPPQLRSSPERDGNIDLSDHKLMETQETSNMIKDKEDDKHRNTGKVEAMDSSEEQKSKAMILQEIEKSKKAAEERNTDLQLDLEKPDKDRSSNKSLLHQVLKQQQLAEKSTRDESHPEKTAQPSSLPLPMPMASWPQMGYVTPPQGVVSMDGNTISPTPIQPIFTQPRPKRCATHCYIARNIHYLQQFMKINPFWPAAAVSAPIFGAKPCNLNVIPSPELLAGRHAQNSIQEKGQGITVFPSPAAAPGHAITNDNKSSQATNIPDPAQRKQQILLQQTLPPVTPTNILQGPAFIFPFNQQQAVAAAAAASVRPGSSKPTSGVGATSNAAATSATGTASTTATAAMSFNYPNMTANEAQYLAILQNNPYPFPIPAAAVGAPPNYRGTPHAQAVPLFNGSYYSSQLIHPAQLQQQQQQQQTPQNQQPHQNSSSSTSSSQKHLQIQQQQQQRQQQGGGAAAAPNGGGGTLHNSYPAHKNRSSQQHTNAPPQVRHLENEVAGGEDSPSTADSRVSRPPPTMSVYGHNFVMPVHSQNYALMNPHAALSNANSNDNKKQHQQQQQGLKRGGADASLPPQTFAMSFAPMNGATGTDMSSMAQNHAIIQSLPESMRQSYHHMMAAPSAHQTQQKQNFKISEETSRTGGHSSSNVDEDKKASGGGLTTKSVQSIAFSRPDFTSDASGSPTPVPGSNVIDSSSRNINLTFNNRSSRSPMSTSVGAAQSSHHLHSQFQHHKQQQQQQQQMLQLQKQQQQNQQMAASLNARSKNQNQPTSTGNASYPEHMITSSSSMAAKFPNSLSSFQQNLVQTTNTSNSPAQSPQWRGPAASQLPSSSTTSSLKNLHQPHQQQSNNNTRTHPQSHTQISFAASNQKPPPTTTSQLQQQNHSTNSNNNNNTTQCASPPMVVGSPTTSSISKGGAGGSPRTNPSVSVSSKTGQASSLSSSAKNSPVPVQRSSPSILGNPHITTSSNPNKLQHHNQTQNQNQGQQQQLAKQTLQQQHQHQQQAQAHLFFAHPYMQTQAQAQAQAQAQVQAQQHSGNSNTASGTSGYYIPRKQQSQQQQNQQSASSTGMLSLCPPVTLASATTSDPAKAIAAAAAAAAATKGSGGLGSQQGILYASSQSSNATHQLLPTGFPQYVHTVPAAIQVKPAASEQKQPAGNGNSHGCWPEKK